MKGKWVVCIKQVPQEPVFKKVDDTYQIDRDMAGGILNPCDRFALDMARDLKERAGGEIVAITMGPPQAEEVLREAVAHGIDKAILLSDLVFAGADTLATAHTLAAAIRKVGNASLILCGATTLDSDTGQVGPQVAELLDLPMVANVDTVNYVRDKLRVERRIDGFREKLQIDLPALITVSGKGRKSVPVSLRSLEEAFSVPLICQWGRDDLDVDAGLVGWEGSATRTWELSYLKRKRSGEIIQDKAADTAERIIAALMDRDILG